MEFLNLTFSYLIYCVCLLYSILQFIFIFAFTFTVSLVKAKILLLILQSRLLLSLCSRFTKCWTEHELGLDHRQTD